VSKTTTIEKELDKLKEGESLVVLTPEGGGYFLGVGDKQVSNTWAITQEELNNIAVLAEKYRTDK
jgi:hypothetical protein